jgi:hypothetical protein
MGRTIRGLRWWIIGVVMIGTSLNYLTVLPRISAPRVRQPREEEMKCVTNTRISE